MRDSVIQMSEVSIEMFEYYAQYFWKPGADLEEKLFKMTSHQETIEDEIEKSATRIITLQQPVSKDTREILCAVRIAVSWKKIGDHVTDISDYAQTCQDRIQRSPEEFDVLKQMNEKALLMILGAHEAYKTRDYVKAVLTAKMDDEIDYIFRKIRDKIAEDDASHNRASLCSMMLANHIERICDHAANICEEIVYLENYEQTRLNPKTGSKL